MQIVLATGNPHKAVEFRRLFPGHEIFLPSDLGVAFDYEESDATYLGNAIGKAMALHALVHRPVLADDSGLSVPALGGEPGVRSARYGSGADGRRLAAAERNRYLLERMRGIEDRRAFFVCCLALVLDDYRFFVVQETVEGLIAAEPAGSGGFGYDPLFLLPEAGRTLAQLSDQEKDRVSHRGRAAVRLLAVLETLGETSGSVLSPG